MSGDWFDGIPGPPRVTPAHPVQGERARDAYLDFCEGPFYATTDYEWFHAGWDARAALAAAEVEQLQARNLPFELRWSPSGGWCVAWAKKQRGWWQSAKHARTLSDALRSALRDARLTEHGAEGTG